MQTKNKNQVYSKTGSGFTSLFLLFILISLLPGCAAKKLHIETALSFDTAVRLVANHTFQQEFNKFGPLVYATKPRFVIDNIIDTDTGEVTRTSERITALIIEEAKNNFPFCTVNEMNFDNLNNANYVIVGVITQEKHPLTKKKIPHLFISIVNAKTSVISTKSDVWISNIDLDYNPTPVYEDSPMFIKDHRVDALIKTAMAESGELANKEYFDTLTTSAILSEASMVYNEGKYNLALGLFAKAAEREDGQIMKTFSGLYQSFFRLKKYREAEEAFAHLAKLGIKNNSLSIKFLFDVDSVEFSGSRSSLREYDIWVKNLAKTFNDNATCLQIIGHASNSGSERYNNRLSLSRAKHIQAMFEQHSRGVSDMTYPIGRGFSENIIGTGTNDARDAIDRRVELRVVSCTNLRTTY